MDGQLHWRGKEFREGISSPLFLLSSVFLAARGALSRRATGRSGMREFGYTVFYKITRHNRTGSSPKKVLLKAAIRKRGLLRAEDTRRRELINPRTSALDNTNSSELSYFFLIHSVCASQQLNKSRRSFRTKGKEVVV